MCSPLINISILHGCFNEYTKNDQPSAQTEWTLLSICVLKEINSQTIQTACSSWRSTSLARSVLIKQSVNISGHNSRLEHSNVIGTDPSPQRTSLPRPLGRENTDILGRLWGAEMPEENIQREVGRTQDTLRGPQHPAPWFGVKFPAPGEWGEPEV